MGIREIEKKMKFRQELKKKAAELEMQELENKAKLKKFSKERLKEIARKHGVLIALDDSLKEEVEKIRKEYGITDKHIIKELLTEEHVLKKGKKIDHEKLGMLIYQRVMLEKDETGGLLLLPDVYDIVNTGVLKGRLIMEDIKKAVQLLKKNKVIPSIERLENGVWLISFFPVQYTSDQSEVIKLAQKDGKGVLTLERVCGELGWPEKRALRALENLVATGIAKTDESYRRGKRWFFPGIK
ncbi:MAG: hypothetical protein ACTSU2_09830 [Promethearchaeota archaeon]